MESKTDKHFSIFTRPDRLHCHQGSLVRVWSSGVVTSALKMFTTNTASESLSSSPHLVKMRTISITSSLPRPLRRAGSQGPGDVGRVLLGLHAQHGDAGRAPLKLRFGFKGRVGAGGRREDGVCAEEVVQGDVAKLVLLTGEAHVAVVGCACSSRARGVGGDAWWRASRQHAGGNHRAPRSCAGPQVVGDLLGKDSVVST